LFEDSSLFISFTNNAAIPAAFQSRPVAYRQTSGLLYSEAGYVAAVSAATLPLALLADFIYGTVL
jgi:hypothetical protein